MSAVAGQSAVAAGKDGDAEAMRKRKAEDAEATAAVKMAKVQEEQAAAASTFVPKPVSKANTKAREIRLEQNRKAARESRRRKKVMIEELQRSVIFFSRANGTLKQQNDELTRYLMQAQMQIAAIESHNTKESATAPVAPTVAAAATNEGKQQAVAEETQRQNEQAHANAVATQAMYETKGYPASAARAAAQAMNGTMKTQGGESMSATAAVSLAPKEATPPVTAAAPTTTTNPHPPLPQMQPGATMQAMANFQQAAAAAMQSAMGQMQNVPGVSVSQLAAAPAGTNAQQAYTDTMTALAMQQAAAAAAAGMIQPGMPGMPFLQPLIPQWPPQQQQQQPQPQQQQQPPQQQLQQQPPQQLQPQQQQQQHLSQQPEQAKNEPGVKTD